MVKRWLTDWHAKELQSWPDFRSSNSLCNSKYLNWSNWKLHRFYVKCSGKHEAIHTRSVKSSLLRISSCSPVSKQDWFFLFRREICRCCLDRHLPEVLQRPNHWDHRCLDLAEQQEKTQTFLCQMPPLSVLMENQSDTRHSGENIRMRVSVCIVVKRKIYLMALDKTVIYQTS